MIVERLVKISYLKLADKYRHLVILSPVSSAVGWPGVRLSAQYLPRMTHLPLPSPARIARVDQHSTGSQVRQTST